VAILPCRLTDRFRQHSPGLSGTHDEPPGVRAARCSGTWWRRSSGLPRLLAAGDVELGAGDPLPAVRGQEGHRLGDVTGVAEAPERLD
jgi:hypothetical protein